MYHGRPYVSLQHLPVVKRGLLIRLIAGRRIVAFEALVKLETVLLFHARPAQSCRRPNTVAIRRPE